MQGARAVPGLYSHIAQYQDQDFDNIPKPFKSTKGRGGKKSGKGKQKSQQQPQPPPPEEKEQYEETNNYYHNENYGGNNKGCRPFWGPQGGSRKPYKSSQKREGASKIVIGVNTKATIYKAITIIIIW